MSKKNRLKKQKAEVSRPKAVDPNDNKMLFNVILPVAELVFILFFLRFFVLEAYQVPTGSMIDTILPGDFLLVEKINYRLKKPTHGDVVVFQYPIEPRVKYVKRCVAIPGDTLEIKDKILYVNGEKSPYQAAKYADQIIRPRLPNAPTDPKAMTQFWRMAQTTPNGGFLNNQTYQYARDNFGPVIIPEDHIMAMGDNRDNSHDSRFWGPVPYKNITGRPTIIYLSTDLVDDLSDKDIRSMNMFDNAVLMLKSVVQFWHLRFDRMFRIIA